MDNTNRVAQWRQRMRDEGKEALTVWLSHDTKLRLEDLASVWHMTTSEMVEQALAQFHPGNPPRIGNETDTAQIQALMQETVRAMLPELRQGLLQEVRGEMAVTATNGNVTETVSAPQYEAEPGHSLLTEPPPPRKSGRKRSEVGQRILDLLAAHPEGLTAEQLRGSLTPSKPLGDTLSGMRRTGGTDAGGGAGAAVLCRAVGRGGLGFLACIYAGKVLSTALATAPSCAEARATRASASGSPCGAARGMRPWDLPAVLCASCR